jgi:hypothetical protein
MVNLQKLQGRASSIFERQTLITLLSYGAAFLSKCLHDDRILGNRPDGSLVVKEQFVALESLANFIGFGQLQVVLPLTSEGLDKEMTTIHELIVKIGQYILDWIVDAKNCRK